MVSTERVRFGFARWMSYLSFRASQLIQEPMDLFVVFNGRSLMFKHQQGNRENASVLIATNHAHVFSVLIVADHVTIANATEAQVAVSFISISREPNRRILSIRIWLVDHHHHQLPPPRHRYKSWTVTLINSRWSRGSLLNLGWIWPSPNGLLTSIISPDSHLPSSCLSENKWNYLEAAKNFQDLKSKVRLHRLTRERWLSRFV